VALFAVTVPSQVPLQDAGVAEAVTATEVGLFKVVDAVIGHPFPSV